MDRLLTWTPGDRSDGTQARLFDEWLNQLSLEATGLKLQTSPGACDTAFSNSVKSLNASR